MLPQPLQAGGPRRSRARCAVRLRATVFSPSQKSHPPALSFLGSVLGFFVLTSPSLAPHGPEQDTYLVLDDFGGTLGCSWRETNVNSTDRETLIRDLVEGQYSHPIRIVAFNTIEGWSRDATAEIAEELGRRYIDFGEVPESVVEFIEVHRR